MRKYLGDYFLPHFREVFNYYLKYFLMVFLFVFFFWDPYDLNVVACPAIPLMGIHTEETRRERDTCTPMFES